MSLRIIGLVCLQSIWLLIVMFRRLPQPKSKLNIYGIHRKNTIQDLMEESFNQYPQDPMTRQRFWDPGSPRFYWNTARIKIKDLQDLTTRTSFEGLRSTGYYNKINVQVPTSTDPTTKSKGPSSTGIDSNNN